MSIPDSRDSFKKWCLTKLGYPVLKVNVTPQQIDDRVDEALKFWWDYSIDGSEKTYFKYQITDQDKANKYITLPDNIMGAVRIFDIGVINSSIANPFNLNYQIALNDLYTLASSSMIPYYTMMVQLEMIQQMLVGQKPIRYDRITNKLYVDMNWDNLSAGMYLLVEAYEIIDPEEFTKAYGDRLLLNYATALIKRQWAENTGKFDAPLDADIKLNYQKMWDEATEEIEKIEQQIMDQNIPPGMLIG